MPSASAGKPSAVPVPTVRCPPPLVVPPPLPSRLADGRPERRRHHSHSVESPSHRDRQPADLCSYLFILLLVCLYLCPFFYGLSLRLEIVPPSAAPLLPAPPSPHLAQHTSRLGPYLVSTCMQHSSPQAIPPPPQASPSHASPIVSGTSSSQQSATSVMTEDEEVSAPIPPFPSSPFPSAGPLPNTERDRGSVELIISSYIRFLCSLRIWRTTVREGTTLCGSGTCSETADMSLSASSDGAISPQSGWPETKSESSSCSSTHRVRERGAQRSRDGTAERGEGRAAQRSSEHEQRAERPSFNINPDLSSLSRRPLACTRRN